MTCIVYVFAIAPVMYACFGFLIRYRYVKARGQIILDIYKHLNIFVKKKDCDPLPGQLAATGGPGGLQEETVHRVSCLSWREHSVVLLHHLLPQTEGQTWQGES